MGVRLLLFGATFPLSSPVALSFLAGLKAAFQLTNEAGGVQDGMNLSLAVLDDRGEPRAGGGERAAADQRAPGLHVYI